MISRSAPSNLELIKQIYSLYPEAIAQACGQEEELVLHVACWRASPMNVVEFLALQHPDALLKRTHCGLLPIHLSLIRAGRDDNFRAAALDIVKLLLKLAPEKIPEMHGPDGESILEFVFSFAYQKDLVDFVWERHPHEQVQKFSVDQTTSTESAPVLDLQQAAILSHLLSTLTHFECCPRSWTNEAFTFLMERLQQSTTIESLGLRIPMDILLSDPSALTAFEGLLKYNPHLRKISLSGGRSPERMHDESLENNDDDSSFLEVLVSCFQHYGKNLEIVMLSDLILLDISLAKFLESGILPQQKLAFYCVALRGNWQDQHNWEGSHCRSLTFFNCPMDSMALKNLLLQCSRMPSLRHLALGIKGEQGMAEGTQHLLGLDVTRPIVEILARGHLQVLVIRGPAVNSRELAAALKKNMTLRYYVGTPSLSDEEKDLALVADALEHHNTALEGFDFDLGENRISPAQEKISHFTKLNDFGRQALRRGYLSREEFVTFLCFAAANQEFGPVDTFNVHYGLLRELPTLWCHVPMECQCGTKRKCLDGCGF